MQGEADNYSSKAYYNIRFDTLKDRLRRETFFPATTPIVVGGLMDGASKNQDTTLQAMAYNNDPWVTYADAVGATGIAPHFDGYFLKILGRERFWRAYQSLPKQFSTLSSPNSQVSTYNGNIVVMNAGATTKGVKINLSGGNLNIRIDSFNAKAGNRSFITVTGNGTDSVVVTGAKKRKGNYFDKRNGIDNTIDIVYDGIDYYYSVYADENANPITPLNAIVWTNLQLNTTTSGASITATSPCHLLDRLLQSKLL